MKERNWRDECSELEDADYFVDMGTTIHKGKSLRGEGCYVKNSDRCDEDYVRFLEGLEEFWESKYKVVDDDDDHSVVVDDDDDYLAFLDNLKEHGNAYMCDVSVKYGVLSPIVYEEDDSDSVLGKTEPPKSHGGNHCGEKRKVGVVLNNSNVRTDLSDGIKGKTTTCGVTHEKKKVREFWRSGQEETIAQKDLPQRSSEAVLGVNHFADMEDHFEVIKGKTATRGGTHEKKKKKKVGDNWRSRWEDSTAQKDFPQRSSKAVAGVNHSGAGKDHAHMIKRKTTSSCRVDCTRENGSIHMKGNQRSGSVYSSFGDQVSEEINETYKEFLNNLYYQGGCMIFKYGDKELIFGSSDQQSTDDEVDPLETDIRSPASLASMREVSPNPRPLKSPRIPSTTVSRPRPSTLEPSTSISRPETPPSREKTCKYMEKSYGSFSWFWKELHDYLRMPYKQKEFDELMHEVSVQKPVKGYRDNRRGGCERPTGKLAKSYLQLYSDVDAEIKKVKSNRYKVLNLLRMFVFYLKKIPSGCPKPWEDHYSKTILPGS